MLSQDHMAFICTVIDIKHWQSFSCLGHMACVGVCLCIAGVVRLHFSASLCLRVFARARTQPGMCARLLAERLWWPEHCVCVYVCACVPAGGMPAPEQSPVTEEGLLLTIRDSSTGRNMEADNTANNILASVKEQVVGFFHSHCAKSPFASC